MARWCAQWVGGTRYEASLTKVICVGRNYAAHARELDNPIPEEPLLFLKPPSAVCDLDQPVRVPRDRGAVHFEAELALLVGKPMRNTPPEAVRASIAGVGLALDLTLRDLQSRLKAQGHPWERAKAFDGACPISPFLPTDRFPRDQPIRYSLWIDETLRQQGDSALMLTPMEELVAFMSQQFTLEPGDVILTGTPEGVGPLEPGQALRLDLANKLTFSTQTN